MLPDSGLGEEAANAIIMAARAHWFEDEPATESEEEGDGATATEEAESATGAVGAE